MVTNNSLLVVIVLAILAAFFIGVATGYFFGSYDQMKKHFESLKNF